MVRSDFKLSEKFIEQFKTKTPPFGYGGLGELVYKRTYSRVKPDGTKEDWWETCRRVVEFIFNSQMRHVEYWNTGWNAWKAQNSAQEMYTRLFELKWTPPGRGLWAAGTGITDEKELYAALNNCAFVSTKDMAQDVSGPFKFLMDMSMLGVGVGFDLKGEGTVLIKGFEYSKKMVYTIPDTREGWVESVALLIENGINNGPVIEFDYSEIRKEGMPIKTFGGVSSGAGPLEKAHEQIASILEDNEGKEISGRIITDIMNIIGTAVISGNVRRSAEIVFGPPTDEYLNLKNYEVNPERMSFGWSSNNSVLFNDYIDDYKPFIEHVARNGEPGFAWLNNMKAFSRMDGTPDWKDRRAVGGNPCLEQTLETYELCTLVETFPAKHDSLEDYITTLKYAYLYAKTITLLPTHWHETNAVMMRNRRIGCSVSGIAQAVSKLGINTLKQWLEASYDAINEYDKVYSDWLAIPTSIKKTSVKPSGTVSLLAGATPGVHLPISQYYIRRIRIGKGSELINPLKEAGYHIEPDVTSPETTMVVSFPIGLPDGVRTLEDSNIWEQLEMAAFMQEYWADNQVSCTVSFRKDEVGQIASALRMFQYRLKGVSFLPISTETYEQMPYEKITKEEYDAMMSTIKNKVSWDQSGLDAIPDKFCDGDVCFI